MSSLAWGPDRPAYLDHAATTPMRPEAVAAMLPFLTERFGNPSGSHSVARAARVALDEARERVACVLGARPGEVVFTSGGTEADNLAIVGSQALRGGLAVCPAAEHHAVLHACAAVGSRVVPTDADGAVDLDALAGAMGPDVAVISVMAVNNEVGTVSPLAEVAEIVRRLAPGAVLHTDAVQAAPWFDLAGLAAPADLVSVASHKVGGPKGTGALVVREGTGLRPVIHGGGQERDLRSGTHDVAGIVGMAAALEATAAQRDETVGRVSGLRDRLADGLADSIEGIVESVSRDGKAPGHCHVRVPGVEAEEVLLLADEAGLCASAGSACASGATEPSHVLAAMGVPPEEARGALRLTLGWCSTERDVEVALQLLPKIVSRLRA
ncbi:MAG: cysteine desulfurase family protein [Acidimicrobiales bacterium]